MLLGYPSGLSLGEVGLSGLIDALKRFGQDGMLFEGRVIGENLFGEFSSVLNEVGVLNHTK
jgi:hypothetical protein